MNSIKIIITIVSILAAVVLGFSSYRIYQENQSGSTNLDSIDQQLEQDGYCDDTVNLACYNEQEFNGTLKGSTLTVANKTFTIREDDETGPHLGKLMENDTLVRVYIATTVEEIQTLELLETIMISETFTEEQCVFGRHIFPTKGKAIEDPVFPLEPNQAILELYPCFDSEEEKQYILEDLKIIYLDDESDQ